MWGRVVQQQLLEFDQVQWSGPDRDHDSARGELGPVDRTDPRPPLCRQRSAVVALAAADIEHAPRRYGAGELPAQRLEVAGIEEDASVAELKIGVTATPAAKGPSVQQVDVAVAGPMGPG